MTRSTLDFFAAKASARRRTAVLVALFALAWASTIAVVYAIVVWVASAQPRLLGPGPLRTRDLLGVAGIVTLVTAGGALVHAVRLASGGGRAVAELLGGFPVDPDTQDAAERRLVNVVEEMAIAAGVPVPALYVLPFERNLNAFAAGFSPDHAVVAVTRGALEGLTRDELQGVVAHELSHVVNADTRLNLQLIALVGGLTSLALVGRALVRAGAGGEGRRGRGRGGAAGLALFGALVWLAGSIGAFFGSLIRAAVSRTREFLADADAVRLTRNPEGLAGALARIAREGSRLWSPAAPEAAHLFIADGLAVRLFATHPPIEERIRRIAPLVAERLLAEEAAPERPPEAASAAPAVSGHGLATAALAAAPGSTPGAAGSDVARAQALLAALPAAALAAARGPGSAPALVRALLADPDETVRAVQLPAVADPALRAEVARLAGALSSTGREGRMALLDVAAPALGRLAPADGEALVRDLAALAAADRRTTVFEWSLQRVVAHRLAPRAAREGAGARRVAEVEVECLEVLSVLAWQGAADGAAAQAALDAAVSALGTGGPWRVLPRGRVGAARLETALASLDAAAPRVKERVLAACEACVTADGKVRPAEGEVLRAIAASLGVPAPPILAAEERAVRAAQA